MHSLVDQFIEALRELEESENPALIVALFREDAEIANPLVKHEAGSPDAAARFWRSYRASFREITSEFRNIVEGDGVGFLEWVSAGSTAKGEAVRYGGVSVVEHEGGLIHAFRTYFDTAQIRS